MFKIMALIILLRSQQGVGEVVDLNPDSFTHITFDGIPTTKYHLDNKALVAHVKNSSSVLLKAFDKKKSLKSISFKWKSQGILKTESASQEQTKSGDDAILRVGLILSGKAPMVPFFAPAWIKKSRDALKLPSNKMIYLTVGSKNKPGSQWESPYSSSIISIALPSTEEEKFYRASHKFPKSIDIVGLWIFADGDNTKSSFNSTLWDLKFLP